MVSYFLSLIMSQISDFTEKIVAQFHAVYPSAYSFRYDKQLDKITKLQLSSYTLVFVPNLRTGNIMIISSFFSPRWYSNGN